MYKLNAIICANANQQLELAPAQLVMRGPYVGRTNQVLIIHTTRNQLCMGQH